MGDEVKLISMGKLCHLLHQHIQNWNSNTSRSVIEKGKISVNINSIFKESDNFIHKMMSALCKMKADSVTDVQMSLR